METLPEIPEGLSAAWVIVGAAIVAIGYGAYRAWKWLSPTVKAEREGEARRAARLKTRLGRLYDWAELATNWIFRQRQRMRIHNEREHPNGEGAIEIEELPPSLQKDGRTYAAEGESDD